MIIKDEETAFEKLIKLTECLAKEYEWGGMLNISFNENRTSYISIREYLIHLITNFDEGIIIDKEDMIRINECEKSRNIYQIHLYNINPCGHYSVFDSTLEGAAFQILQALERDCNDIIVNYKSLVSPYFKKEENIEE